MTKKCSDIVAVLSHSYTLAWAPLNRPRTRTVRHRTKNSSWQAAPESDELVRLLGNTLQGRCPDTRITAAPGPLEHDWPINQDSPPKRGLLEVHGMNYGLLFRPTNVCLELLFIPLRVSVASKCSAQLQCSLLTSDVQRKIGKKNLRQRENFCRFSAAIGASPSPRAPAWRSSATSQNLGS